MIKERLIDFYRMPPVNATEEARTEYWLKIGGTAVAGFLALLALGKAFPNQPRNAVYDMSDERQTMFEVETREGPVVCYGPQNLRLESGGVGQLILDNTILAGANATPDIEPIVNQVLVINTISDPLSIPRGEVITVPYACEFVIP